MKKFILTLAAALFAAATLSAQASFDMNVITRLEAHPSFSFDNEPATYDSGNSVIYTQMQADFGEHVSFTMINHWAETGGEKLPFSGTADLYRNIWRSDANTFIDYLYFDFKTGGWNFRVGKDVVALGGFEYDEWDWDCDFDMCSLLWNCNAAYQWGGSVSWTNDSENTTFMLQAASSPYQERPWYQGLGSYTFQHVGSYGSWDFKNSLGFTQTDTKEGFVEPAIGVRFNALDNLAVGLDAIAQINPAKDAWKTPYTQLTARLDYSPCDQVALVGKFGFENNVFMLTDESDGNRYLFGGLTANFFPVKDSEAIRIHATLAGNSFFKGIMATVGVTFNVPVLN